MRSPGRGAARGRRRPLRGALAGILAAGLVAGCEPAPPPEPDTGSLAQYLGGGSEGYARATEVRDFRFPADHGAHPDYRSEWWYFTGNFTGADGRDFGFQLTLFRFALAPEVPERASAWAADQAWMGHFAVTDVAGERFHAFQRLSRGALGLAGTGTLPAGLDPGLEAPDRSVWLEDWVISIAGAREPVFQVRAAAGDVAVDLRLEARKPLVLQGDRGLSQKSAEPGNASYYYSATRLDARGTVTADGVEHPVTGLAWLDREWSTSALADDQEGWDWFALQLDDGHDLMYYQLRLADGSPDPYSKGILVGPGGEGSLLRREDVRLTVLDHWTSPETDARYPSGWRLEVPGRDLALTVTPRLRHQELDLMVRYWEGAVRVEGTRGGRPVAGRGYVELTGY